jgi:LemA protein
LDISEYTMTLIIIAFILIVILIWGIMIYNKLVSHRNMADEGWSSIDVQLKRRADLIPNLIQTVSAYMKHEEGLLSRISELRSQSIAARQVSDQSKAEGELSRSLGQLFAIAENYPDLKANQNFLQLQNQLSDMEEHIQMARRYYNGSVRNYNIQVESFPDMIIASSFKFRKKDYFELVNPVDREVPKVDFSN